MSDPPPPHIPAYLHAVIHDTWHRWLKADLGDDDGAKRRNEWYSRAVVLHAYLATPLPDSDAAPQLLLNLPDDWRGVWRVYLTQLLPRLELDDNAGARIAVLYNLLVYFLNHARVSFPFDRDAPPPILQFVLELHAVPARFLRVLGRFDLGSLAGALARYYLGDDLARRLDAFLGLTPLHADQCYRAIVEDAAEQYPGLPYPPQADPQADPDVDDPFSDRSRRPEAGAGDECEPLELPPPAAR